MSKQGCVDLDCSKHCHCMTRACADDIDLLAMCCSACRAVWYCGTACSHADWRAGHRRVCKALAAARAAEKERRRQQLQES